MANKKHLAILNQGKDVWNQWRHEHPKTQLDLSRANLRGADLSEVFLFSANLRGANLSGAILSGATLISADLCFADLSGAILSGAVLARADLRDANLRGADLSSANLRGADLSGAKLNGADLNKAYLGEAYLRGADLSDANLQGADLSEATLTGTKLTNATLRECRIFGVSVWDSHLDGAEQLNLIITPQGQPTITVDDLEVAQFIYLLLNHQKLRNVLNAVTERGVLLLGRFGGGGLDVLQAVAANLREGHYLPIIFDFERPQDRDYTETVKTLAGLSRFIIADLSGPSVPQELYAIVPHFAIPVVPILEKRRRGYAMFADLLKHDWVLRPPIEFADVNDLQARMPSEVIAPAEEKHRARQQLLDELFRRE